MQRVLPSYPDGNDNGTGARHKGIVSAGCRVRPDEPVKRDVLRSVRPLPSSWETLTLRPKTHTLKLTDSGPVMYSRPGSRLSLSGLAGEGGQKSRPETLKRPTRLTNPESLRVEAL